LKSADRLSRLTRSHLVEIFQGFFGSVLPKAASTSSAFMRLDGSPDSFRFCSSVPSPIIPGWVILDDLLGALTIGLFVTRISLCICDDAAALSNDTLAGSEYAKSGSETTQFGLYQGTRRARKPALTRVLVV